MHVQCRPNEHLLHAAALHFRLHVPAQEDGLSQDIIILGLYARLLCNKA